METGTCDQPRRGLLSIACCDPFDETVTLGPHHQYSSLAAKTGGLTAGTAYAVSKGALSAMTFSLARELAADGHNGQWHRTGVRAHADGDRRPDRSPAPSTAGADSGRTLLRTWEFAHVVRFLASPLSGFITGEIIDINGGLLMD